MAGETILIVEDSPTERALIQTALQSSGFRLLTAADGDEAMAKIQTERPSLVLLDVVLPGQNGFQLCRQLKTAAETKAIKVVMLTSKNQDSDRFWGLKQGADDYVTKPFDANSLLATLRRQLAAA
ncbi:MAG TPA: response regulator [Thermoanaerobaculia bacterium]|nr:response regulator [Thermoanaerobaculia bacterium]